VYQVYLGQWDYYKGQLHLYRNKVYKTIYIINNLSNENIELYVEHPRNTSCNLIETDTPDETKDHFYRFLLKVPKKDIVKFVVSEQASANETHYLASVTKDSAEGWFAHEYIDKDLLTHCHNIVRFNAKNKRRAFRKALVDASVSESSTDVRRIEDILGTINDTNAQSKFKNFFTGELQAVQRVLKAKQEESEKMRVRIAKTEEKKTKLAESLKFTRSIDIITKKVTSTTPTSPVPVPVPVAVGKGKTKK